ncbi:hypothetical protein DU490_15685 [Halomonas sp. DQ26W]|uniref:hypothetical protein n=1 Tax=Halomonas sp. DQ26W TaxID=2282311 RepID=UPI000DF73D71|nr:hypothetical protein [Halomonas sp. DQ26W]RDB41929.1 hypothetical protein DU490_15685 [Halomonas sp. DQ26W]
MSRFAILLLVLVLTGCAVTAPAPDPRELSLAVMPGAVLQETVDLLMDEGYVIRHADAELGRVEATLSRWPGYRVRAEVMPEGEVARISMTATRGGRPLPPHLLDRLLAALQTRLGLAP